jgi:hypothetical protein
VYSGLSRSAIAAYRLGTTPETIVVSARGVGLGTWDGAYTAGTRAALEHFFAVSLPVSSPAKDQPLF